MALGRTLEMRDQMLEAVDGDVKVLDSILEVDIEIDWVGVLFGVPEISSLDRMS